MTRNNLTFHFYGIDIELLSKKRFLSSVKLILCTKEIQGLLTVNEKIMDFQVKIKELKIINSPVAW